LVEPLPAHQSDIKKIRTRDKLICGTVTNGKTGEVEFYVNHHEALSSLLKNQAEKVATTTPTGKLVNVLKTKAYNINEILKRMVLILFQQILKDMT
jgi:hypothetical protein